MKKETMEKLKILLEQAAERGEIPGAIFCVEERGERVCCLTCGYADLENKIPMRQDHIFRLYSMTKPVTAAAAMALMERGMLDLAEPVARYLPAFRQQRVRSGQDTEEPAQRQMMIKDLLNMTSGLMYSSFRGPAGRETAQVYAEMKRRVFTDSPMGTVEFAQRLGEAPLAFSPGLGWLYGSSADVLGAVLEKAAGMPFSEVLEEFLLKPLQMTDTGFYVPQEKQGRLAKFYEQTPEGLRLCPDPWNDGVINAMDRKPAFECGGGGLASTVDDYMNFARMLLCGGSFEGKSVLKPNTVRYFTQGGLLADQQRAFEQRTSTLSGFTYGNLMRVRTDRSRACYLCEEGEYGWDGWLGCFFANDPHNGRSIVFMTQRKNSGTLPIVRKLCNVIYSE